MKQTFIYTTLPNGKVTVDGQQYLRISLHCGLRLSHSSATTLDIFPEVLQWAQKIKNVSGFKVRWNGSEVVAATGNTSVIDTEVWGTLIHPGVKVSAFIVEDKSGLKIHAYPTYEISQSLLNVYRDFGIKSPVNLLKPGQFLQNENIRRIGRKSVEPEVFNAYQKIEDKSVAKAEVRQDIKGLNLDRSAMVRPMVQQQPVMDYRQILQSGNYAQIRIKDKEPAFQFARFRDFHRIDVARPIPSVKPVEVPEFEFHDILAQMSDYPQMLRKLGLVIDLMVPFDSSLPHEGRVSAFPVGLEFNDPTEVSVTATAYRMTSKGFFAREKSGSELRNGFVKLNTSDFSVAQIDTDGTAIQTINKVDNQVKNVVEKVSEVQLRVKRMTPDEESVEDEDDERGEEVAGEEGLPTIKSAGIAIIKNNVETYLNARFVKARQLDVKLAAPPTLLPAQLSLNSQMLEVNPQITAMKIQIPDSEVMYANDLVMGYRMDVAYANQPDKWYSLQLKQDEITVYDENKNAWPVDNILPDEGFNQLALTEDEEGEDVFVTGVVARWTGWSLAVERPGFAINEAEGTGEEAKDYVNNDVAEEEKKYGYHPEAKVRMNVRSHIVPGTLPSLRYGNSYHLRMRYVDVAGNSVPLEATPDNPAEAIVQSITYRRYEPIASPVVLAGNKYKIGEDVERLVIKSDVDTPVQDYSDPGVDPSDREARRLLIPPSNSQLTAERHGKFEKAFSGNMQEAKLIYGLITSHETPPGVNDPQDKVYNAGSFKLTYLPDPAAAGVAVFLAEDYEDTHTQKFSPHRVAFIPTGMLENGSWLNVRPVTIELVEGDAGSEWNESSRILTFSLPKGHRARIKYTCYWKNEDLQTLSGIWEQLSTKSGFHQVRDHLREGRHWMVSPAREMELVHAIQRPLRPPVLNDSAADRGYLDTPAWIKTRIRIHGQSTGKVELDATWKEWDDNPLKPLPLEVSNRKLLDSVKIKYNEQVHHVGYFPPRNPEFNVINTLAPGSRIENIRKLKLKPGVQQSGQAKKKARIENKQGDNALTLKLLPVFSKAYVLKAFGLMHNFDDTRHRFVDYKPIATTRYPEYFRQPDAEGTLKPIQGLAYTQKGEPVRVNILSSDRPSPPEVEYIIPTFNWHKSGGENQITHLRSGGGLRVYLKRPWFSSGEGEMLGVVLAPQGTAENLPELPVTYSQWGSDPVFPFPGDTSFHLESSHFKWHSKVDRGIVYPGINDSKADVVAFAPQFDAERKLWYADLSIDPLTRYFPFVKLILARYQEHSLRISNTDVCLSPVVETDFIQLVPERKIKLSVERRGNVATQINVEISGNSYAGFDNSFEIKIISSNIPQPISGVISASEPGRDSINEETLITNISFPDNYNFVATANFRITSGLRKVPFDVVVLEYEKADKTGRRKLVFADEFNVNKKEK
ncbi:hypothetical protein [Marinilabilia sp.]|uniref:hypothetical protein n=1 Tax=Marinilabilia sp. TaxID=2021252 RepID=UPI0025BF1ED9|nr:hypothetical protein [Marinilabilia sp.]